MSTVFRTAASLYSVASRRLPLQHTQHSPFTRVSGAQPRFQSQGGRAAGVGGTGPPRSPWWLRLCRVSNQNFILQRQTDVTHRLQRL